MIENKFPGKDISDEDLKTKFPLSSSINPKKIVEISNDVSFGGKNIPFIAGPNVVENKDLMFKCCEILEKKKYKMFKRRHL